MQQLSLPFEDDETAAKAMENLLVMPHPLPDMLPPGTRLLPPNEHLVLELPARLDRTQSHLTYSGPWGGVCRGAHPSNVDWTSVPEMHEVTKEDL